MSDSTAVRLVCVVIDDDLKVANSPFTVTVPPYEDFGGFVDYVKAVTPSLKDKDHGKFKFYKPPLDHPIPALHSLHGFQLTREHLGNPILIACKTKEVFQEKEADRRFDIDVIIHTGSGGYGTFSYFDLLIDWASICMTLPSGTGSAPPRTLLTESSDPLLRAVTLHLQSQDEVELPPVVRLLENNIHELSTDEALPDFVRQLERELDLQRFPGHDVSPGALSDVIIQDLSQFQTVALSLLDSVKILLGDKAFCEYFTDPNGASDHEMRRVTAVELLHYIDVLLDQHLSDQDAYRDNAEYHIYSLLRRFSIAAPPPPCGAKFLL
jgi:hypothetical protein